VANGSHKIKMESPPMVLYQTRGYDNKSVIYDLKIVH